MLFVSLFSVWSSSKGVCPPRGRLGRRTPLPQRGTEGARGPSESGTTNRPPTRQKPASLCAPSDAFLALLRIILQALGVFKFAGQFDQSSYLIEPIVTKIARCLFMQGEGNGKTTSLFHGAVLSPICPFSVMLVDF